MIESSVMPIGTKIWLKGTDSKLYKGNKLYFKMNNQMYDITVYQELYSKLTTEYVPINEGYYICAK